MNAKGFTLFELLFTASLAISVSAMAIPGFKHFTLNSQISSETQSLTQMLRLARKESITKQVNVVVCATSEAQECHKDWSKGYMIFVDKNNDNQFTDDLDILIQFHKVNNANTTISWRSFRGNKPIRFIPAGITWHFNGTFILCQENNPEYAKALFMAKSGRIEESQDSNHDGIDELRDGSNISCS